MMFSLLEMPVRSRRDVIWAQQRLRRLAGLLCFDGHEQALIAACAFAVANHALEVLGRAKLCAQVADGVLHVFAQANEEVSDKSDALAREPLLRMSKELPGKQKNSTEDVGWIASQLPLLEKLDVFEEMRRQNQDVLALLCARQHTPIELDTSKNARSNPTAA
ncbi:MAG: hypothetical protein HY040_02345 [Planctomycetes bacterium]|nr:hypothetical protein [Planctomycetota bacterium]